MGGTTAADSFDNYLHHGIDIRDAQQVDALFSTYSDDIDLIVHTAAQPSHDWAAREPVTDFTVNANGTLMLLEAARRYCPKAVFVFMSTNKVYGDRPNELPLVELDSRWEVDESHPYHPRGIDETMSIDSCTHSLFGASKVAADVLVQEYGRYFGMNTVALRGDASRGQAIPEPPCTASSRTSCSAPQPAGRTRCSATRGRSATTSTRRPDRRDRPGVPQSPSGRGVQHGRRAPQQLLHARGDRAVREARRTFAAVAVRGDQPDRRPPMVDQRHLAVRTALSGLDATYDIEAILTDILGQAHDRW